LTLAKAKLDNNIVGFFSNYLIGRYMQYIWNNFTSPSFQTNIRVEQRSFLLPILLALYLTPVLRIWEKRINNLSIPILASILSFIDNDLFVSQEKNFEKTNTNLFLCFNMFALILYDFALVVDYSKSEVFHFT